MFRRHCLCGALISALALFFHSNALAQTVNRSKTIKEINSLRKKLREKEKLLLLPSDEDQAAFAKFLRQPKTGLVRLLPRGLYEDRIIMRGGGAYYSFSRKTHEYGYGSDIELQMYRPNDYAPPITEVNFHTGFAGADYGFIVTLGEVPIEEVTLDHDRLKFLADYRPPSAEPRVRLEQQHSYNGVLKNGYEYKNDAPAILNYTYALRSINYGKSDVLVAFRVVRKESDGSVVILWKMLKRFPTPHLQR